MVLAAIIFAVVSAVALYAAYSYGYDAGTRYGLGYMTSRMIEVTLALSPEALAEVEKALEAIVVREGAK